MEGLVELVEGLGVFGGDEGLGDVGWVINGVLALTVGSFDFLDGGLPALLEFLGGVFLGLAGEVAAALVGTMEGFLEGDDIVGEGAEEPDFGFDFGGGFAVPGVEEAGVTGGQDGGEVVGESGGIGDGVEFVGGVMELGGVVEALLEEEPFAEAALAPFGEVLG